MKNFNIIVGEKQYIVEAEVIICGPDLNVCIGGGEGYHIGAVAYGIPRERLADRSSDSASVSVFCAVGHRDDGLAREAALELSALFQCRVNVALGLHIDDATKEDIQILCENFKILLLKIKEKLYEVLEYQIMK